jgi:hypothetical protein
MNNYPVARVQSPVTIMKYLHQANNGGLNAYYQYPETASDYNRAMLLKRRVDPRRLDDLVTEDAKTARVIGFIPEFGSLDTSTRNQALLQYLSNNINKDVLYYRITGTTYLIDKSHELLSINLIKGLLTAIGIIGIVLGIYFRSFKLLLISLLPNLIPLILIAGVLGMLGISLKMTTSIIFTIAFGIAVDDTIHLMANYLNNPGGKARDRLKETFKHAGSAMVITSAIMVAGFSLFLLSSFGATFYLGLFICLSMLLALIIDLTLLPLLLIRFVK